MLGCEPEETVFEDGCVRKINTDERVTLAQISVKDQVANDIAAVATASHSSPVSPPPYMVGMVEIELDRYTGGKNPRLCGSCGLWNRNQPGTCTYPGRGWNRAGNRSYVV